MGPIEPAVIKAWVASLVLTGDLMDARFGRYGRTGSAAFIPWLGRHHGKSWCASIAAAFRLQPSRAERKGAKALGQRVCSVPALPPARSPTGLPPKEGTRGEHDGGRPESQS